MSSSCVTYRSPTLFRFMSRLATRYLTNRIPRAANARTQTAPAPTTPPINAPSFLLCPVSDSEAKQISIILWSLRYFQNTNWARSHVSLFLCLFVCFYSSMWSRFPFFFLTSSKVITVAAIQCSFQFSSQLKSERTYHFTLRHTHCMKIKNQFWIRGSS